MESDIRCKLPMKKKNRNKKRRGDQLTDQSPDDDSSTEQSPVFLDVVCGHNRAKLSLDRLGRGTKTACVLVDEAWMTPNQYQHVSGRGTARDWKRSIKHNGTSLKALLSNKTLCLNPPSCRCNLCNPTAPKDGKVGVDDVKEADQENLPPGTNHQAAETGCNKSGQETTAASDKSDKQQYQQQQQLQQQLPQQQQQLQQQQQQQQHGDEPQPQPLVPHPPKSASLGGDLEENWTRKRKLMSALALQATSAGKKRILEYKERRRMRKEKRLNAGSDEGTALKKIKMDDEPESKCSPGKEVVEETSSSPSKSSLVQTCEDKMASGSFGEISMDERNLSMVKEATMLHIVTELRNYRKNLEERIDASRRCSANLFSNEPTIVAGDNRQSVIQSHRKERTLATKNNNRRSTDEHPLPDLVRSHYPTNISVLQSSPCAIPASKHSLVTSGIKLPLPSSIDARPSSKLSPKTINRQFSVDQYGVLDLSTKSHDASPGYSYAKDYHCQSNLANYFLGGDDSEGEQVLDLSKNSSLSVTPPSTRTASVQLPAFGPAKSILRPPSGSRQKKTRTRKRCPTNLDRMLKWSVNDVAKFASGITGCEEYSEILTKFGVTGASLPLLTVDHMIGTLRMRQTAAHSFRLAIDRLVMS